VDDYPGARESLMIPGYAPPRPAAASEVETDYYDHQRAGQAAQACTKPESPHPARRCPAEEMTPRCGLGPVWAEHGCEHAQREDS
jgi:hypothetical protein